MNSYYNAKSKSPWRKNIKRNSLKNIIYSLICKNKRMLFNAFAFGVISLLMYKYGNKISSFIL